MERLRRIVTRLRQDCPWDRKQTVFSMRQSVIEEAYELSEAIQSRDFAQIKEEVGDYMFIAFFLAQIMQDTGKASYEEIVEGIAQKLIARHPHVFGKVVVRDAEEVVHNWNKIKQQEQGRSILDCVPKALPALQRAESIQKRAKRVGFDWKNPADVLDKVEEETRELRVELRRSPGGRLARNRVREELGDLLFALVNAARHLDIDAEDALQRATAKFTRRFRKLEAQFARQGRKLDQCTLAEMDAAWEANKKPKRRRR